MCAARGYTNQYLVADVLGKHDGVPPVAMLDVLIEAAETWIDSYTNSTWLVNTVTAEAHTLNTWPPTSYSHYRAWGGADWWDWSASNRRDPLVTLNFSPVTSITAVRSRSMYVGAPVTTLVSGTDYELVDGSMGLMLVTAMWFGSHLSIDYAVNIPLPADLKLAATKLVTYWVQPMLNSGLSISAGIKSYAIGPDLSVTFQDASSTFKMEAPPDVVHILDHYVNVLIGF